MNGSLNVLGFLYRLRRGWRVTGSEVTSALELATSDGVNHTCSDHRHPARLCKGFLKESLLYSSSTNPESRGGRL